MGCVRFFLPAKTTCHDFKNEMHEYRILQSRKPDIHTRCTRWSNSHRKMVHRSFEAAQSWVSNHFVVMVNGTCLMVTHNHIQCSVFKISWPRMVWKRFLTLPTIQTSHSVISSLFSRGKRDLKSRHFEYPKAALRAAETAFKFLAWNGFQDVFDEW